MKEIHFFDQDKILSGYCFIASNPKAWVIFAHGSGSSRKSVRNTFVAKALYSKGFGCLLFDLLTEEEDQIYANRFDIDLLTQRLILATDWLKNSAFYQSEPIAYFGASTGSACALIAASKIQNFFPLFTIISRGGRPDLAGEENLKNLSLPILLIVGSKDEEVMELNRIATHFLKNSKLVSIPGAHHLFEEPGALEEVTRIVGDWLLQNLPKREQGECGQM